MFRAVIFDLDGTLSDSIHSIQYCADRALAPEGFGPFSEEEYKYFVGDGAANLIRRALAAGGDVEGAHFESAFARYKEIFAVDCMYQVKPYEGIPELVAALKERGMKIAVLSNKPHAETIRVIETLFGKGCFDVIRGQMDGVPIKPDPAGAECIMDSLGVKPEEVLYLGDTATDMKTGKGAGAFTVGVLWGFRTREELEGAHADAIIERPLDALALMDKMRWEIRTERLRITPLRMQYAESLHPYISDVENARMMLFLPHDSYEETLEFVRKAEVEWRKPCPEYYEFIVLLQEHNVASVSVYLEDNHTTGELGYIIDKSYWHLGIATEAMQALIRFSVEQLGLKHFTAHCDADNAGSRHVLEKLGMKLTNTGRKRRNRSSEEEKTEYQYDLWV